MADFALHDALRSIFELVAAGNRYVDSHAPWQLGKARTAVGVSRAQRAQAEVALQHCLSILVRVLLVGADSLTPFLPSTANTIRARLLPAPSLGPPLFAQLG